MADPPESDERAPLLRPVGEADGAHNQAPATNKMSLFTKSALLRYLLVMFVAELASPLIDIPMLQIQEEIICEKHHPDIVGGADPRCKDTSVQSDLAFLTGWSSSFVLVPSLVTAVPYGYLADKYGRAMIMRLSIFGMILWQAATIVVCLLPQVLPIQMIWIAPVFNFIGGGPSVFAASLFALVSDVTPKQHVTAAFSYFSAAAMTAGFVGSPLTYLAMSRGPWFSVAIGFGLYVLSFLLSFILPGGQYMASKASTCESRGTEEQASTSPTPKAHRIARLKTVIRDHLLANKALGALLLSLFVIHLGRSCTGLLSQYTTRRYEWSWSEAGLLSMIRSGVGIGTTFVLLPATDYYLRNKLSLSLFTKDLRLVQSCILLMVFSLLLIGLSPNSGALLAGVVFWALTSGDEAIMRSLLSQAADPQTTGMVYTSVSVLETVSALMTGPAYAAIFQAGLSWGGGWLGTPFLLGAVLIGIGGVLLCLVRNPEPEP